jgi:glycine/D-amino acid oxidase-like deaminating enzyme
VKKVLSAKNSYEADAVIIATGSWSREVSSMLDLSLPLFLERLFCNPGKFSL